MLFEDKDDILRKVNYLSTLKTKVRMNVEFLFLYYFRIVTRIKSPSIYLN